MFLASSFLSKFIFGSFYVNVYMHMQSLVYTSGDDKPECGCAWCQTGYWYHHRNGAAQVSVFTCCAKAIACRSWWVFHNNPKEVLEEDRNWRQNQFLGWFYEGFFTYPCQIHHLFIRNWREKILDCKCSKTKLLPVLLYRSFKSVFNFLPFNFTNSSISLWI